MAIIQHCFPEGQAIETIPFIFTTAHASKVRRLIAHDFHADFAQEITGDRMPDASTPLLSALTAVFHGTLPAVHSQGTEHALRTF